MHFANELNYDQHCGEILCSSIISQFIESGNPDGLRELALRIRAILDNDFPDLFLAEDDAFPTVVGSGKATVQAFRKDLLAISQAAAVLGDDHPLKTALQARVGDASDLLAVHQLSERRS